MNKIRFQKSDCTISHVVAVGRLRRTFSLILTFFKLVCKLLSKCYAFVLVKYLRVISVPKIFWWPPKSRFFSRNFGLRDMIILTNFDHFHDQKIFFWRFKDWFGVVQKLFYDNSQSWKIIFCVCFQLEMLIHDAQNWKDPGSNFGPLLTIFGSKKFVFLTVWKLFGSCPEVL